MLTIDKNEPLYFTVFPQTNSTISELMVGGYQRILENNFFDLIINSAQKPQNQQYRYGNPRLELYPYSRCGFPV
ncbi:hypothetical protein [Bartonella taylorii]|uniref:hypothetical protein n=1 Tax=Bartonella taylorii TaxID=33046 RepID=UPI001FEFE488|nr:hypothetical protein [Bartonella taylorii]